MDDLEILIWYCDFKEYTGYFSSLTDDFPKDKFKNF